jgi:hypothetical protein
MKPRIALALTIVAALAACSRDATLPGEPQIPIPAPNPDEISVPHPDRAIPLNAPSLPRELRGKTPRPTV